MEKEAIKVGATTVFLETLEVTVLLDDIFSDGDSKERFRMIETDGYHIVSIQDLNDASRSIKEKCFLSLHDAWIYLDLLGIDRE